MQTSDTASNLNEKWSEIQIQISELIRIWIQMSRCLSDRCQNVVSYFAECLMGRVAKLKLQYFGHITRRSAGQLALTVLEGIMEGLRHQGRLRRRWIHDIEEWTGCKYIQLKEMSQDRAQWRRKISEWFSAVANPHRGRSTNEWVSEGL